MEETDDFDRHAGKAPADRHPVQEGARPDHSDQADLRVAQPGEDPPGEDALARPDASPPGRPD
jgi:hypothetical protein